MGTSAGGALALALGQRKTLTEIRALFEGIRATFQGQSMYVSEMRRWTAGASHDNATMDALFRTFYGEMKLSDLAPSPKIAAVSASVSTFPSEPYLFRSYALTPAAFAASEFLGTNSCLVWEAGRCTTSAPTFTTPTRVGGQHMTDGAIVANNPTLIALTEAALLWPGAAIDAVVSLGSGRQVPRPSCPANVIQWVRIMVDVAMNSYVAHRTAATLLGTEVYFRLDAEGAGDVAVDEVDKAKVEEMLVLGREYCKRNDDLFARVAKRLAPPQQGKA